MGDDGHERGWTLKKGDEESMKVGLWREMCFAEQSGVLT